MVEMGDTPTDWELVQFVTSMAAHRAGSPRTSTKQDMMPCFNGLGETGSALDLILSQEELRTMEVTESQDLFNLTSLGSQQLLDKMCLSDSSELFGFSDSQELLDRLAARHFIEYESDSEVGSDEGEVIEACLQISLFSPQLTRAALEPQADQEVKTYEQPLMATSKTGNQSALSPLSLLSRKLGERLAGEQREACTQTSQASLSPQSPPAASCPKSSPVSCNSPSPLLTSSPSVASSGLPSLSPCTPAQARPLLSEMALSPDTPPPESTSPEVSSPEAVSTSLETTRDSYTTTSSSQEEAGPRDSLQDIIFDTEETARVRQREKERQERELERQDCKECREKQRQRHSVRFNLEEEAPHQRQKPKKVNLCAAFLQSLQKLIVKFKSKLRL